MRNYRWISVDFFGDKLEVGGTGDHEHFEADSVKYNGEDISNIIENALSRNDVFWNVVGVKASENFQESLAVDGDAIRERKLDI